jgi:hydrogenase expression/formation protein HypC
MCLAIPAKIEQLSGEEATVQLAGTTAQVVIALVPQAKVGDWVLVHAGYAIAVVPEDEARKTFALLAEMERLAQE